MLVLVVDRASGRTVIIAVYYAISFTLAHFHRILPDHGRAVVI